MNIIVTGGAGFIGSHFVLRHVASHPEDSVVVLDKLTYAADKSFLDPIADQITFVEGDIADQALVTKLVEDHSIDTIINFAAESHVDNSISDATPFLHTNVIGTQAIIEVVKEHPAVRLLHISTDEVYGDVGDSDPSCKVTDAQRPSSPYSASKAAAEMLVLAAIRTFDIQAVITRCTNNYGSHQADEKFIPTVIRNALANQPIPIFGTGKNKRDWIYVGDHCDAIETLLTVDWKSDQRKIFNVGIDKEYENIEVAKMILDILGKPHDLISFVEDRLGHDWRYAVDSSQTRTLGWEPKVNFEEGLKETIEWYKEKYA
ncbi:MAG: dTDP-glucose 4,6-dehydratase [Candidatus Peribacteraceae bacterium]|jgi:dTDP-glucose 4,6-dehydratase|nr:dTDP-glucose 4,6-dehydratase [bacterium]MDP6562038.1 dTDP-glucose 4,6-dehydratase [Candidatus Peribacteraceae bacterium]|tara:strand:+ start:28813 stop:29763 length:951 start_codon:yes stop_codon:yes gene_type:complete